MRLDLGRLAGACVGLVMLALMLGGCADPARAQSVFAVKHLAGSGREYALFSPRDVQPGRQYPMIVFLHGIGEGGSDIRKPLSVGLAPYVADHADTFPFFVLVPQSRGTWDENSQDAADVIAAIYEVERSCPIDQDRVFLTGLSTGGYGTFAIGAKYAGVFAGLVPLCPNTGAPGWGATLAQMNVWAFENAADPFAFPGAMAVTLASIRANGGNPRHTVYPAFGHNCWDTAYSEGQMFEWMKQHRRGDRGVAMAQPTATPARPAPRPAAAKPTTPAPVVAAPVAPNPVLLAPVAPMAPSAGVPAAMGSSPVPPVFAQPSVRPAAKADALIPAPGSYSAPASSPIRDGKPMLPPVW